MANGHGGRRKGAGRPKGSRGKSTIGREVRLKDFMNGKTFVSPMEFLTTLMNDESADENAKTISNSKLFSIINGESERLN